MHINYMNNTVILLDKYAHDFYEGFYDGEPPATNPELLKIFDALWKSNFIVDDNYNEKERVKWRKVKETFDATMYHLVINPNLACNLSCWYCYEHKYKESKLNDSVVEGIKKHLCWKTNNEPFSLLKLSFFGGEPFYNYSPIKTITEYAAKLCKENKKSLYLDFTTNGTLLTKDIARFLSGYSCQFEITIDGNSLQHNKIKHTRDRKIDTYSLTFANMRMIQKIVPNSLIYLPVNFDDVTLSGFDDILQEIKSMDNKRTIVILKRIWQVDSSKINNESVIEVARKLNGAGFKVDYYTQGKLCFAERYNEAVINYDGNVFKCTTIPDFNLKDSYGKLDLTSGKIIWDESKRASDYDSPTPEHCLSCKRYPICYGPCPNQINVGHTVCYLDSLNMPSKEYFQYLLSDYQLTNGL